MGRFYIVPAEIIDSNFPDELEELRKDLKEFEAGSIGDITVIANDLLGDLQDSAEFLEALQQVGVDNWCGYDEAQAIRRGWQKGGNDD